MKTAFRLVCLLTLVCGTWAVVGAEGKPQRITLSDPKSSAVGLRVSQQVDKPTVAVVADKGETVAKPATASTPSAATGNVPMAGTTGSFASSHSDATHVPMSAGSQVRVSMSTLTPTPEMWFYEQMRQDYNNPELQARRRAELEASQRRARIAAREWYGYSNSRPTAHPTPHTYYYSATWGSNTTNPFIWSGRTGVAYVPARVNRIGLSGFGW
jgi:hypothetical protein